MNYVQIDYPPRNWYHCPINFNQILHYYHHHPTSIHHHHFPLINFNLQNRFASQSLNYPYPNSTHHFNPVIIPYYHPIFIPRTQFDHLRFLNPYLLPYQYHQIIFHHHFLIFVNHHLHPSHKNHLQIYSKKSL